MKARADAAVPRVRRAAGPEIVRLEKWFGPVTSEDPNANFKDDVARHSLVDPMTTIRGLADSVGLPVGAVARYVLARYATSGSGGLLELGPSMVQRLWEPIAAAEAADNDSARLAAYSQLRQMISWLRAPLVEPSRVASDYETGGSADQAPGSSR